MLMSFSIPFFSNGNETTGKEKSTNLPISGNQAPAGDYLFVEKVLYTVGNYISLFDIFSPPRTATTARG